MDSEYEHKQSWDDYSKNKYYNKDRDRQRERSPKQEKTYHKDYGWGSHSPPSGFSEEEEDWRNTDREWQTGWARALERWSRWRTRRSSCGMTSRWS